MKFDIKDEMLIKDKNTDEIVKEFENDCYWKSIE